MPEDIEDQLKVADESVKRPSRGRNHEYLGPGGGEPAPYPGLIIEEMMDSASINEAVEIEAQHEVSLIS